jgi:hypothetical protein
MIKIHDIGVFAGCPFVAPDFAELGSLKQTEPLMAVGCLSIICGWVAPVVGRSFSWQWSLSGW